MCSFVVVGQSNLFNKNQRKVFLDGESYYIHGDYLTAIKILQPLVTVDTSFKELSYILGDSYFQLKNYKAAESHLIEGIGFNNDANFLLAKVYLNDAQLEAAKIKIDDFDSSVDFQKTKIKASEVKQFKSYLKNAKKYLAKPEIVNISNLGRQINTENSEYVPLISSDEELLIFTSRRMHEGNQLDPFGQPFEDIYYSEKTEGKKNWSTAKLLNGEVNTPTNDACVGLSPDGYQLFVFRTNENLIGGDLYDSKKILGEWTIPVKMDDQINNDYSVEPSASISLYGDVFYFSSNREGGYGGFDIYRVVRLPNGDWSLPLNLGDKINTPFNDDAPYIHPNGKTLYFSSEGHSSMGGFDIFKSEKIDTSWSTPENLGHPTNTTKDDIFFTISANEQHGYYSSDKEGGFGGQDLYQIDYLEKRLRQSVIRGTVKNTFSQEFLNGDITMIDVETGDLVGVYVTNPEDSRFIFLVNPNVEYELIVEVDGYEEYSEIIQFSIEDLMETQRMVFYLTPTSD